MTIASITVVGHVGRLPKEFTAPSGKKGYNFSVAVNINKEDAQWFEIFVYGFENLKPYIVPGRLIYVSGVPHPRTRSDGTPYISISATEITLLGRKPEPEVEDSP